MIFTDDVDTSLEMVVALVNSTSGDTLGTVGQLDEFYREYGFTGRHERTRAELDEVLATREQLRALLLAPRDQAAEIVNAILREHETLLQLSRHDTFDWHLHAVDSNQPLATRILIESVMAMVEVIRDDEHGRIKVCADDTCNDLVLDLSRNRSKIFCSTTCGNRNAAAAYRARKSSG